MADGERRQNSSKKNREDRLKLFFGKISCVVGILLGLGGTIAALLVGSANISAGAVGAALGLVGYSLGSRRVGAVSVAVGVIGLFFVLGASQGLIAGMESFDHNYPTAE
jgi:hypothetical protein